MRIRIEVDDSIQEEEVIIRCSGIHEHIQEIQQALERIALKRKAIVFYREETEYYFALEEILFFETGENRIYAHTIDNVYHVKYKLYELEEMLPTNFMRISKSTILNIQRIYSITRNLSSSVVEFQYTHKQVYVSRHYYKVLKARLEEKRRL